MVCARRLSVAAGAGDVLVRVCSLPRSLWRPTTHAAHTHSTLTNNISRRRPSERKLSSHYARAHLDRYLRHFRASCMPARSPAPPSAFACTTMSSSVARSPPPLVRGSRQLRTPRARGCPSPCFALYVSHAGAPCALRPLQHPPFALSMARRGEALQHRQRPVCAGYCRASVARRTTASAGRLRRHELPHVQRILRSTSACACCHGATRAVRRGCHVSHRGGTCVQSP